MSNRMTQIDGEVPRSFPLKGTREQATGFPIKVPTRASPRPKEDLKSKKSASKSRSLSPRSREPDAVTEENRNRGSIAGLRSQQFAKRLVIVKKILDNY